ncbi:hypothetical protein EI42_06181 [Thermosporothrix hazakensis]|uniref:Uncharacterized protein n=1 Tax=Thermosporothrix hazakensis TaxID=644383 RepID=A0A326TT00_THEHA|nr:hypothetical protein EI42_06181 [Thermosporothrix hazakensis]
MYAVSGEGNTRMYRGCDQPLVGYWYTCYTQKQKIVSCLIPTIQK